MAQSPQRGLELILNRAPVLPVIVIDRLAEAVPLARALVAGGLPVLEVTLRSDAALDAIRAMLAEVEGAVVGAGTVLTRKQVKACRKAGAAFGVSPGATGKVLHAVAGEGLPFLPGAATASEAMALLEQGYALQKFFPAAAIGGAKAVAALAQPLPMIRFCPTGGITPETAPDYFRLGNVITLGGSWMVPRALIAAGAWDRIEEMARAAVKLRAPFRKL
jgi:2-dehydro-3-deoxyphosphogluconate aldolase/(4S)-4-hydroxy-2-oxoglutarate aldolase